MVRIVRKAALILLMAFLHGTGRADTVAFWRLPEGAIQPQAAVDSKGVTHLIYFKGNARAGNLYYVRRTPGLVITQPIRVNSQPDSAGAVGTVRAAQLALGQNDRVHVVWNGLSTKKVNGYAVAYQAYTRLNDAGTGFESQRNLITWANGVDGGGTVAADKTGNVYVAWHAMAGAQDESGRAVFVSVSHDNGKTFSRERQANPEPTGACACCGMRALADSRGTLFILYRAAGSGTHRDTMLLVSRDKGQTFQEKRLDTWDINSCPMSTYALGESGKTILAAWETRGQIYHASIDPDSLALSRPVAVPGAVQKHPFLVSAPEGHTLLLWTEGTGWQKGGALAWVILDSQERITKSGRQPDGSIPVWGLATASAHADGRFTIVY